MEVRRSFLLPFLQADWPTHSRTEYRALEGFVLAVSPFNFTAIGGNLPGSKLPFLTLPTFPLIPLCPSPRPRRQCRRLETFTDGDLFQLPRIPDSY
jgi:hypothetical protein